MNDPPTPANKGFQPQDDWTLVSQGAEARIWKLPAAALGTGIDKGGGDGDEPSLTKTTTTRTTSTTTARMIMAKERFSKSYRHPVLDEKLTKSRCRAEGRILEKCRNNNNNNTSAIKDNNNNNVIIVDVPKVIRVEPPVLYLEYIPGMTVREYLEEHLLPSLSFDSSDTVVTDTENATTTATTTTASAELTRLAQTIGSMVGALHDKIGCIHGDLTTSNMMLRQSLTTMQTAEEEEGPEKKRVKPNNSDNNDNTTTNYSSIALIDFGLAKSTTSAEERAVDLYVLERALTSTHPKLPSTFFDTILEAYKQAHNNGNGSGSGIDKKADATLQRLEQVRLRGRKRECFG